MKFALLIEHPAIDETEFSTSLPEVLRAFAKGLETNAYPRHGSGVAVEANHRLRWDLSTQETKQ